MPYHDEHRQQHTKRQKCGLTILTETYKDFAENTSIHGLKYTVKNDLGYPEKFFWIFIVAAGLISAIYMTYLFWIRYTSNPSRTTILTSYASISGAPFPSISICNLNIIMASKMNVLAKKLSPDNAEEQALIKRAIPQLVGFTHPLDIETNATELMILQDILEANNYYDVINLMRRLRQTCDEMLLECIWEKNLVDCKKIFNESFTNEGICCSFNYGGLKKQELDILHTPYSGLYSGLKVVLNYSSEAVEYRSYYCSGFKVAVHNYDEYPSNRVASKIVAVGRTSMLQVDVSQLDFSDEIKSFAPDTRECLYGFEKRADIFDMEYIDANCLTECSITGYYKFCKCVPYYFGVTHLPICNVSMIPCLRHSDEANLHHCKCTSQCEDLVYEVLFTSTPFLPEDIDLIGTYQGDYKDATSTIAVLSVYFLRDHYTILFKDVITSTIYLLSSFGGVYSLFLGCSLMTIVEILYYCLVRLLVNFKLIGKVPMHPNIEVTVNNKKYHNSEHPETRIHNTFVH